MVWNSDQNYSALISNPDTDNFVQVTQWFESLIRTTQNWSAILTLISADQKLWCRSALIRTCGGGGKVLEKRLVHEWIKNLYHWLLQLSLKWVNMQESSEYGQNGFARYSCPKKVKGNRQFVWSHRELAPVVKSWCASRPGGLLVVLPMAPKVDDLCH